MKKKEKKIFVSLPFTCVLSGSGTAAGGAAAGGGGGGNFCQSQCSSCFSLFFWGLCVVCVLSVCCVWSEECLILFVIRLWFEE